LQGDGHSQGRMHGPLQGLFEGPFQAAMHNPLQSIRAGSLQGSSNEYLARAFCTALCGLWRSFVRSEGGPLMRSPRTGKGCPARPSARGLLHGPRRGLWVVQFWTAPRKVPGKAPKCGPPRRGHGNPVRPPARRGSLRGLLFSRKSRRGRAGGSRGVSSGEGPRGGSCEAPRTSTRIAP
jgi:hypothetical protein